MTHLPDLPLAEQPLLLTAEQVGLLTGRSRRAVLRDVQVGLLAQPLKLGRSARWTRGDVDALIARLESERALRATSEG